jgi:RNA polymerase sigma-70 factor (ECF subfamily)
METDFRQFYESHIRFVWRALVRLGVPEPDVPDAAQDVFLVVHKKLPEFEGRSKITTWLFAICMRVASDRRKTTHRHHETPSRFAERVAAEGQDDPPAIVDRRRAYAVLESILDRMPEEQRIIFSLFELEEMDGREIAELLGLPEGTVRSRLRLARQVFRRYVARLEAHHPNGGAETLRVLEAYR